MSYSFTIEQSSKGCDSKRYIKLKGAPYKVTSFNPDDKYKLSGDIFDDALIPLSISVGKGQYWSFDTAWGLFEFPNKKVTEIIGEKFAKKYGKNNIIMEKYISKHTGEDKSYLLVIRGKAMATIYLSILIANKISKEYVNVEDVYIGVNNDPNMKDHTISNCGNTEHHHLIPNVLRDGMKEACVNQEVEESAHINDMELCMKLSEHQVKKFNELMNDKLEKLYIEDVEFLSHHFKSILESGLEILITSCKKDGTTQEHNILDVIKKIDSVKAHKEHEMVLEE